MLRRNDSYPSIESSFSRKRESRPRSQSLDSRFRENDEANRTLKNQPLYLSALIFGFVIPIGIPWPLSNPIPLKPRDP